MDSVISQQGLEMILASARDSVPTNKILLSLKKVQLNSIEKNELYFEIFDLLKNSNGDNKLAAKNFLMWAIDLLNSKITQITEELVEPEESPNVQTSKTLSPMFRRIG